MDIAGTGYLTNYTYDLAGHKTTVTQGVQQRTFTTDAAGRMVDTTEPERGETIYSYAYNSTGLVTTRKRSKANQTSASVLTTTTTQHDQIGRPVSISYDDGTPYKQFMYDIAQMPWSGFVSSNPKGRMILASASNGTLNQFSYDAAGNITTSLQCPQGRCGNPTFDVWWTSQYDRLSHLTQESYGGVSINTTYNAAGQMTSVTNNLSGASYDNGAVVSNVQNGPFGPSSYILGNGLASNSSYDAVGRNDGKYLCGGSTYPGCGGGTYRYGTNVVFSGARIVQSSDSAMGSSGATYSYDDFNRLSTANLQPRPQALSYAYDRWGNRTAQTVTLGSGPQPQYSFNPATNQIIGSSYDAAGNLLFDGNHNYTYDAEGNVLTVDGGSTATYAYNALNQRSRVTTAACTIQTIFLNPGPMDVS